MPNSNDALNQGMLKPRQLEALAFYLGAHGVDPEPVIKEIDARFAQETSEEKQEPLRDLHSFRGKLQQVQSERPEAETVWDRVRDELGDTQPSYFHAVLMAIFALFALGLDTLFLAPTMDILNIALPVLQFIAAVGFAGLCTAYFELVALLYIGGRKSLPKRVTAIAAAVIGVVSLAVWGLLRGEQLRFSAVLAGNPLGEFLAAHPALAAIFFIFVTLATPMIGAAALLYGWEELKRAQTWRRAHDRFEGLRADEIHVARKIDAEQEALDEFDKRKYAESLEWRAIFAQFYERGRLNGARRETLWAVIWKTILGVLCVSPVSLLLPFAWYPAPLSVPVVVGLACFIYFNHRRHHPSHERYLAQENTQFAVIPDAPQSREMRVPQPRLLSKGDQ